MSANSVRRIDNAGELIDYMHGEIRGAQLVVQTPEGRRLRLSSCYFESTTEHLRGRLVFIATPDAYVGSSHELFVKGEKARCSCGRWEMTSVGGVPERFEHQHVIHVSWAERGTG